MLYDYGFVVVCCRSSRNWLRGNRIRSGKCIQVSPALKRVCGRFLWRVYQASVSVRSCLSSSYDAHTKFLRSHTLSPFLFSWGETGWKPSAKEKRSEENLCIFILKSWTICLSVLDHRGTASYDFTVIACVHFKRLGSERFFPEES